MPYRFHHLRTSECAPELNSAGLVAQMSSFGACGEMLCHLNHPSTVSDHYSLDGLLGHPTEDLVGHPTNGGQQLQGRLQCLGWVSGAVVQANTLFTLDS